MRHTFHLDDSQLCELICSNARSTQGRAKETLPGADGPLRKHSPRNSLRTN